MIMLNARVMCVKDTKYVQRNIPAGTFPPHSIAGLSTAVGKVSKYMKKTRPTADLITAVALLAICANDGQFIAR